MQASDKSIAYTYAYDLHDNPVLIQDLVEQTLHKRKYNLLDQLEEEEINGLTLRGCLKNPTKRKRSKPTLP